MKLVNEISDLLFVDGSPEAACQLERARSIFSELQQGRIDRTLFTDNGSSYFTPEALADYKVSLSPLGAPEEFTQSGEEVRGGFHTRSYKARLDHGKKTLTIVTRAQPDGKLEQYAVYRE